MRSARFIAPLIVLALSGAAYAAPVAVVNGTAIQQSELDQATDSVVKSSGGRVKDTPELRAELKQQLITRQLILQEAGRRGLDKTSQFKERLEEVREDLMRQALFEDIAKQSPVGDAQIRSEYDRLKSQSAGHKEVHTRQIIVGTQAEAEALAAQLKKGGSFEALAKQKSKDPSAKQSGGDTGWVNTAALPKPLADALKPLGKGQVTAPITDGSNWFLFKVEDTRALKIPAYEEAKPQIARQLQGQAIEKAVTELRGKAKIQ